MDYAARALTIPDKGSLNPWSRGIGDRTTVGRGRVIRPCREENRVIIWDSDPQARDERGQAAAAGADRETDDAAEVLREVWSASGQTSEELEHLLGPSKSCRNMQNVGFDALAGSGGGDLRTAWRATLRREGKLSRRPGSVLDLVMGPADQGDR